MLKKKEDRHKGCLYREFCTKEEKWCPYLYNRVNSDNYDKN